MSFLDAIACVISRTTDALDVITSISRYDRRSNLLHFFLVTPVSCGCGSQFPLHRWPRFALLEMPTGKRPVGFFSHRIGEEATVLMTVLLRLPVEVNTRELV